MRAKVIFYNEHTGEIYEETDKVVLVGKKPFVRDRNFIKVFVGFLVDVLEDRELGAGAWRLLLYAIKNMDYNNLRVYMVPEETARELGVSKRTFYSWVKTLTKKGYLEKIATNIYRIKPYTAIKGNMEQTLKTEPDF
jgi:predicted DNA-binding protein (UPF0251 family)